MKMRIFCISCLVCAAFPAASWAYVDPNVGGSFFQMLMPILAVLLGFIAFAWNFIKKKAVELFAALRKAVGGLIGGGGTK